MTAKAAEHGRQVQSAWRRLTAICGDRKPRRNDQLPAACAHQGNYSGDCLIEECPLLRGKPEGAE